MNGRFLTALALTVGLAAAAPSPAAAAELDRLTFELDAVGHIPSKLAPLDPLQESVSLSELRPLLHEVGLSYGVGISELSSALLMRVGYRFAAGALPEGSELSGNQAAERYDLDAVPLTLGWHSTLAPYWLRVLVGVDVGGAVTRMRYETEGEPSESGWSWAWEVKGRLGAHADVNDWLGLQLFAEGRWAQDVLVASAPSMSATGLGIGLAVVVTTDIPEAGAVQAPGDAKDAGTLKEYESAAGASRLDRAFELIRQADEAARLRNFIEAERLYREGVGMLPRDPQTRRNVESPVRVDWARALVEIGRTDEAWRVVEEALAVDPDNRAAQQLRAELPGEPPPPEERTEPVRSRTLVVPIP